MYRLTIEIQTLAELIDITRRLGDHVLSADLETKPVETASVAATDSIKEEAPAPKKSKGKSKPAADVPAEIASPSFVGGVVSGNAHAAPQPNVPGVQPQAPVAAAPVAINRDAYIARATELVAQLKATGLPDGELMPKINEVYAQAGCALGQRIGALDDASLSRFLPLFEQKVQSIVNQSQAVAGPSFI